jgi:hypothetical protein
VAVPALLVVLVFVLLTTPAAVQEAVPRCANWDWLMQIIHSSVQSDGAAHPEMFLTYYCNVVIIVAQHHQPGKLPTKEKRKSEEEKKSPGKERKDFRLPAKSNRQSIGASSGWRLAHLFR